MTTKRHVFAFAAFFLCLFSKSLAQVYTMDGTPITDCNGTFYDSGGSTGNYGNNESFITTVCSDGSAGTHIQMKFAGADLANGDLLCFYDGPNISAPQLACSDDFPPGQPFIVQATAANPSGCITIQFISNGSGTATGWASVISCVASCQSVLADLVSTNPAIVPVDTGWIDVCPGERIFFNGAGIYPQNGFAYAQSDLTTTFEWNFGDGDISYGPNTSHRFDEPGGYYVQLVLTDAQGCRSTNLINQRIRVAPRPQFNIGSAVDNSICAGDTIHLSAAIGAANGENLVITPGYQAFTVEGSRADSLALPDGTGIGYETSIYFTEFSPGQVLINPNDLESICVNMEHSWMRDIEITLTCPNGQSIVLHNFAGQTGGQVYLGIPNDNDGFNPIPGQGFDYCWTPNAPNPTWIQYANTVLGGNGTLPSGDYSTFDPISDLIGCPLNGEWTITVTDLWPIDNGYIFSWGLKFKDELYPDIEAFSPDIVSWGWNSHPSIFYSAQDSISAAPLNAGTAGYVFSVTDEFGCVWDTLINIAVLPFYHPDCYTCKATYLPLKDTAVCSNTPVFLDGNLSSPLTEEVRFEAYPDYKFGFSNHPHTNPYPSPIFINSLGYNTLTNPLTQITSICIDIETDFDGDLNIALRSPDGKLLDLSSGNGAAGDNYKITCFSPGATTPITSGTAPFNGTFRPEGNWNNLIGAQVNGNWQLLVSDGFGLTQLGKIKWWSIGFNFTETITYSWTNAASLSCNNCPTPTANPSTSTQYIMTATNSLNCQYKDTVNVNITLTFPAPTNLTPVQGIGSMNWIWNAVPGATGYEVSVNNGPWIPANGNLQHLVTGLVSGDMVNFQVRAITTNVNCPPAISSGSLMYFLCTMTADLNSVSPATCNGQSNGSAIISVSNATPPVQFFPDGNGPALSNGDLLNLFNAGNHFAIVVDAMGCRDTVPFVISEPPAITLNALANPVLCNGGNTGSVSASASGGVGTLSYTWQLCSGGPVLSGPNAINLVAGCYRVVVTDANLCSTNTTVTVTQPPAFSFVTSQDSVSCFGGSDGVASIQVSGGTAPYSYAWSGGITTDTKTGLPAGFHTVAITDANGCQAVTLVQVYQPTMLVIDSVGVKGVSCFGDSNGSATAYPKGGTGPYSYLWSDANAQTTKKAQNLPAGTYTVTVTDSKGCTMVSSGLVSTPTPLVITSSNVADETCAGACNGTATVQASGSGTQYEFTWNQFNIPIGTTNINTLCPNNYTVTVQDNRGCTSTTSFVINAALPIDIQSVAVNPTCPGIKNGSINTTVSGGASAFVYGWSNGLSTPNLSNLDCGDYTVTVTDGNGCTQTAQWTLVCPPAIQVNSITPTAVNCFAGKDGSILVQTQGGTGTITYTWNNASVSPTMNPQNLEAGVYTVTVQDGNGCTVSATATVGTPTAVTIDFVKTNVLCFGGNTGSLTATAQGGTPGYNYLWNTGAVENQITGLVAGQYTVTVTDQKGCTQTATSPAITQPSTGVSVDITQTKRACYLQSTGEAIASASGGAGVYAYAWSQGSAAAIAANLNALNYTVTATDANGCTGTNSITIQQLDSIQVNVAFSPPTCFDSKNGVAAINFIQGGAGAGDTLLYTYIWSIPNTPSVTAVSGLAGGQMYFLTVSDQEGCSGKFNVFLPQPPEIMLSSMVSHVTCFQYSDGTAAITAVQQAVLPISYQWNTGPNTANLDNIPAGNYGVTVTDSKGCTQTAFMTVEEPAALQATFTMDEIACSSGNNGKIQSMIEGGTLPYTYLWNTGGQSKDLNNLTSGLYILTITDANNCILVDSTTLLEPDTILVSLVKKDPTCFNTNNGRIKINVEGGKQPFKYSLNGGNFGGAANIIGLGEGIYNIVVRDDNGCLISLVDSLNAAPEILVDLGPDTTIVFGQSVSIISQTTNGVAPLNYRWRSSLIDSLECLDEPVCSQMLVTPPLTNTFHLTVTDANGCTAVDAIRISVEKQRGVYVPTGFSPDQDGNNDQLVIHGLSSQVKEIKLFRLYDRWGELLYEDTKIQVNDLSRGWDGTFRGKPCDPGVYVWYLEVEYLDGYEDILKGNTTLIR